MDRASVYDKKMYWRSLAIADRRKGMEGPDSSAQPDPSRTDSRASTYDKKMHWWNLAIADRRKVEARNTTHPVVRISPPPNDDPANSEKHKNWDVAGFPSANTSMSLASMQSYQTESAMSQCRDLTEEARWELNSKPRVSNEQKKREDRERMSEAAMETSLDLYNEIGNDWKPPAFYTQQKERQEDPDRSAASSQQSRRRDREEQQSGQSYQSSSSNRSNYSNEPTGVRCVFRGRLFALVLCHDDATNKFFAAVESNRGRVKRYWLAGGLVRTGETFDEAARNRCKERWNLRVRLKGILEIGHRLVGGPSKFVTRVIFYAVPARDAESAGTPNGSWEYVDNLPYLSRANPSEDELTRYARIAESGRIAPLSMLRTYFPDGVN